MIGFPVRAAGALGVQLLVATGAMAQGTSPPGKVTGVVHDSLVSGGPLGGVEVLIDGLGLVATTDARGRFAFDSIPEGTWRATFFHPALEPFGMSPQPVPVAVTAGRTTSITLTTPSPAVLRRALCEQAPRAATLVLVTAAGAGRRSTLHAEWKISGTTRATGESQVVEGHALGDGQWVVCGAPLGASVTLVRESAAVRQAAQVKAAALTLVQLPAAVSVMSERSDRSLAGSVRDPSGRPIARASVRYADGSGAVETGADGRYALPDPGDRAAVVEARALGSVPVTAILEAGDTLRVLDFVLAAAGTTLPTVTVTTETAQYLERVGFETRRLSRTGRYLTQADIAKRQPKTFGELMRAIPGWSAGAGTSTNASQRSQGQAGKFAGSLDCMPLFYIDGVRLPLAAPEGATLDSNTDVPQSIPGVDRIPTTIVHPEDVAGVEVYSSLSGAPAQYRPLDAGCGIVLVWTKRGATR